LNVLNAIKNFHICHKVNVFKESSSIIVKDMHQIQTIASNVMIDIHSTFFKIHVIILIMESFFVFNISTKIHANNVMKINILTPKVNVKMYSILFQIVNIIKEMDNVSNVRITIF